ncbi:hypothetical protein ACJZ2D_007199 [Fusarium nematophilum]
MSPSPETPKLPAVSAEEAGHTSDSSHVSDELPKKQPSKRRKWIIIGVVVFLIVLILGLTLGLYYGLKKNDVRTEQSPLPGSDTSADGSAYTKPNEADEEIELETDGEKADLNEDKEGGNTDVADEEPAESIGTIVDLGYSQYEGKLLDNGISVFLGMRYASPPTGDRRWRAPVAPESTEGIQSAQNYGAVCPGVGQTIGGKIDEDCLFVNIWTPTNATSASKLPVMVYFQPGGYIINSAPYTNGTQLVNVSDNGIIVVTFHYRVGLFGFLASNEVKKDGDLNAGLLDQRMLLKWIQEHISSFGGDPEHVVIQGESAGAGSVALHLVAYGGKDEGLFAAAIAESPFVPGQPKVDDLEYQFDRVVNGTGCLGSYDKMACLRGKSSAELQAQNIKAPFVGRTYRAYFYWAPCTDGDMFPDYPSNLYDNGDFVQVPILFGACTNEGSNYAVNAGSADQFIRYMLNEYPYLTDDDTETIRDLYPLEDPLPQHDIWFPSASRAYGEVTFICPVTNIVNAFAAASKVTKMWSYRYNVQIDEFTARGLGVPHVANNPAVFGPDMTPAAAAPSYRTYNAPMVPIVQKYWISFVRAFDPNEYRDDDAPEWDTWGDDQRRLMFELGNNKMESVGAGERERCQAWLDMGDSTKK